VSGRDNGGGTKKKRCDAGGRAKDKAKKASVKAMRNFSKSRVFGNELISQEDKFALGIWF